MNGSREGGGRGGIVSAREGLLFLTVEGLGPLCVDAPAKRPIKHFLELRGSKSECNQRLIAWPLKC